MFTPQQVQLDKVWEDSVNGPWHGSGELGFCWFRVGGRVLVEVWEWEWGQWGCRSTVEGGHTTRGKAGDQLSQGHPLFANLPHGRDALVEEHGMQGAGVRGEDTVQDIVGSVEDCVGVDVGVCIDHCTTIRQHRHRSE